MIGWTHSLTSAAEPANSSSVSPSRVTFLPWSCSRVTCTCISALGRGLAGSKPRTGGLTTAGGMRWHWTEMLRQAASQWTKVLMTSPHQVWPEEADNELFLKEILWDSVWDDLKEVKKYLLWGTSGNLLSHDIQAAAFSIPEVIKVVIGHILH